MSERDFVVGSAIETVGMFREREGMLGLKLSSRRASGVVVEDDRVTAAGAEGAGEGAEVGEVAERKGINEALMSGSEILIA